MQALKAGDSEALQPGEFISTDDAVTARVRCDQLGLDPATCEETTTWSRACNFRARTEPPLGASFCGNGVAGLFSELPVNAMLAMPPAQVALHLRAALLAKTPDAIAAKAQWLQRQRDAGRFVRSRFDSNALTFIISSWVLPSRDWTEVNFAGTSGSERGPLAYDHGALVPIVVMVTPRPDGDGLSVYHQGTPEALKRFGQELGTSEGQ